MMESNYRFKVLKTNNKTYTFNIQENLKGENILVISEINNNPKIVNIENQQNCFVIRPEVAIDFSSAVIEMANILMLSQYSKKSEL
jgi:hypothetical protein